jgi:hypothetical protein
VSKKPEVLPGNIVRAIVEKTKADNPNPETMIPVAVVLYIQEGGEYSRRYRSKAGTYDLVWETLCNGIQRCRIT